MLSEVTISHMSAGPLTLSTLTSPIGHGGDQENWGGRPTGEVVTTTVTESPGQGAGRKVSLHAARAVQRQTMFTPIHGVVIAAT